VYRRVSDGRISYLVEEANFEASSISIAAPGIWSVTAELWSWVEHLPRALLFGRLTDLWCEISLSRGERAVTGPGKALKEALGSLMCCRRRRQLPL
jgi:hypothetical protein